MPLEIYPKEVERPVEMTQANDLLNSLHRNPFAIFAAVVLAVVIGFSLVLATDVFLLIFLGVLFAVFLVQTTVIVQRFLPLNYTSTLGIVVATLFAVAVGLIVFSGASIETQLAKTTKELGRSRDKVKSWLDQNPNTMALIGRVPFAERILNLESNPSDAGETVGAAGSSDGSLMTEIEGVIVGDRHDSGEENAHNNGRGDTKQNDPSSANHRRERAADAKGKKNLPVASDASEEQTAANPSIPSPNLGKLSQQASAATGTALAGLGKFFSKTFGLLASSALIVFVGLFIAVDPALYRDGFVKLLPPKNRSRATEVMDKVGLNLFNWLNGRFIAMLITGLGTGVGLWILGVPLASVVGLVTALMTFIPNIGGFVALLLATLMGLPQGPSTVVWIVVLYGALQLVESNIITPLVQQQKTSIPPALLLGFQLLMGVLTGFLGLLVATPLLAGLMVLVKEIWISDILGDGDIHTPTIH